MNNNLILKKINIKFMTKKNIFLVVLFLLLSCLLIDSVNADDLMNKLKGKILLQVEQNGEAYYVNPINKTIHSLGRPADAFSVMREQGVGITNSDLNKIPVAVSE